MKKDILSMIEEVGKAQAVRCDVPVFVRAGQSLITTRVAGMRRRVRVDPPRQSGFFRLGDGKHLISISALDGNVLEYVGSLPRIQAIVCRQIDDSAWLAAPVNRTAAADLGLVGAQIVHMCDGCERFDQIICAVTTDSDLIYAEHDYSVAADEEALEVRAAFERAKETRSTGVVKPKSKVLRVAVELAETEIVEMIDVAKRSAAVAARELAKTVEGRLRLALEAANAILTSWVTRAGLTEVRWRIPGGGSYSSVVRSDNLYVINAGICLSGEDEVFDLTTLVSVVRQGENDGLIYVTRRENDEF